LGSKRLVTTGIHLSVLSPVLSGRQSRPLKVKGHRLLGCVSSLLYVQGWESHPDLSSRRTLPSSFWQNLNPVPETGMANRTPPPPPCSSSPSPLLLFPAPLSPSVHSDFAVSHLPPVKADPKLLPGGRQDGREQTAHHHLHHHPPHQQVQSHSVRPVLRTHRLLGDLEAHQSKYHPYSSAAGPISPSLPWKQGSRRRKREHFTDNVCERLGARDDGPFRSLPPAEVKSVTAPTSRRVPRTFPVGSRLAGVTVTPELHQNPFDWSTLKTQHKRRQAIHVRDHDQPQEGIPRGALDHFKCSGKHPIREVQALTHTHTYTHTHTHTFLLELTPHTP